ncbi:hypothetical protein [Dactylosporangium matsuzakiense]|uniref:Uncharacterized protein n=1 Tax=Dactylosporangium matsuzakiense TaxID=53360 RepID=A0A9W6KIC4_9ACTN|nr:hypothetical protein [Dactylosporangium matsuzakiense]UWZ46557.1 hypothetical protein Dmats_09095 [Dactylosporangium matsuzakiense]GLL01320.1 hypothetical protein GCM10017581_030610 [Dactylosporangium matsuzakiense]
MSSEWKKRKRRAESVAEDAWDYLNSALDSARSFGGTVKDRAGDLADTASDRYDTASDRVGSAYAKTSDRVGSVSTEAWKRANRALDALSGKQPRKPWGWIAVAVLGGVAVGWAVAASAPKAIQAATDRFSDEPDELSSTADAPAPYERVVPNPNEPVIPPTP